MAVLLLLFSFSISAQVWISKTAYTRFFSETPLENIEGISKSGNGAFSTQSGKLFFKISIRSFHFEKSLMEEHFNENYMESEKFPFAEFDGIVQNSPDLKVPGTYDVEVLGKLTIHGQTRERKIPGKIIVGADKITCSANFKVKCADHKIEIPTVVISNIAEELDVSVQAEFLPNK